MTYKEYCTFNPSFEIDWFFSEDITKEEIELYYKIIREELLNGKYTIQNDEKM